ncbi:tetraspanin-8 [Arapaima gigas]
MPQFFTGLLLIFILLLATGILGALWKDKSQDLIKKELEGVHLSNATQKVQAEVQALEKKGRCCGLTNGPSDWGTVVPPSCDCVDESAACETVSERKLYKTPCIEFLKSFMKQHLTVLLGVAFAIAVLLVRIFFLLGQTF